MKGILVLASLLVASALFEVAGDAGIRWGLRGHRWGLAAGAAALVAYGFTVNLSKIDFSRLMGAYIAVFFVVSQIMSVVFFREKLTSAHWIAGALIVCGGLVLTVSRP